MSNIRPVDLSNVLVHMPVRAQTMLVNGIPVQSVGQFDYSSNFLTVEKLYVYDPSNNGLDPYYLDPSNATSSGQRASRSVNEIYKSQTVNMQANPILHSNKFAMNLFPVYQA
jgi:hypothetical protein